VEGMGTVKAGPMGMGVWAMQRALTGASSETSTK
jgi:hypothetical protein